RRDVPDRGQQGRPIQSRGRRHADRRGRHASRGEHGRRTHSWRQGARPPRRGTRARRGAEGGTAARVIDLYTIKPIDAATLVAAARETGRLVTADDLRPEGGPGEGGRDTRCA